MVIKKVLLLDESIIREVLEKYKGKYKLKINDGTYLDYEHQHSAKEMMWELSESGCLGKEKFDLIIIGNDHGIGLLKAAALRPELRAKAVVVSDGDLDHDFVGAYCALGVTRAMSRDEFMMDLEMQLEV